MPGINYEKIQSLDFFSSGTCVYYRVKKKESQIQKLKYVFF